MTQPVLVAESPISEAFTMSLEHTHCPQAPARITFFERAALPSPDSRTRLPRPSSVKETETFYGADPKSAPAPAVTAIAKAPQNVTRVAPVSTFAPPADAAHAPSAARKSSEAAATTGIRKVCGARITAKSGSIAPTAKLAAEDSAACT